jgi:hypothetical protein
MDSMVIQNGRGLTSEEMRRSQTKMVSLDPMNLRQRFENSIRSQGSNRKTSSVVRRVLATTAGSRNSLGGIVVKEMLRRSSSSHLSQPQLHNIFESTFGIGTPHCGADPRGFLQHVAEKAIRAA